MIESIDMVHMLYLITFQGNAYALQGPANPYLDICPTQLSTHLSHQLQQPFLLLRCLKMSLATLPVIDLDVFLSQPQDAVPVLEECKKV